MPVDPTFVEVIREAITSRLLDVHTAIPAVIQSYDASTQTCEATPVVARTVFDADDEKVQEELPAISNIPVIWPRGGGFFATLPLTKGDHVMLLFSEAAMGQWRSSGEISEEGDLRRHGLGYPVALPGIAPDASPIADARDDAAVIGKDGSDAQVAMTDTEICLGKGAVEKVARADRVLSELEDIATAFNGHVHLTAGTGTPSGPVQPPSTPVSITPSDPAADIVKGL